MKDLSNLTPEQKEAILKAAFDLLEVLDLAAIDDFIISYAWTKAEQNEPADDVPFKLRTDLKHFAAHLTAA